MFDHHLIFTCVLAVMLHCVKGQSSNFLLLLDMIDEDRDAWVDAHNYLRRLVNDPEAANMKLMTWDNDLEELAQSVVRTCKFFHTSEVDRKTDAFEPAGENLYAGGEYRFSQMMTRDGITRQWYDEINFYDFASGTCDAGKECGHYRQVVWADTYKVGCAIGRCSAISGGNPPYLVSCNYGPAGNRFWPGGSAIPPYTSGASCSQCDSGDYCTDQLCSNDVRDTNATAIITTAGYTSTSRSSVDTTEAESTSKAASLDVTSSAPGGGNSNTTTGGSSAMNISQSNFLLLLCILMLLLPHFHFG